MSKYTPGKEVLTLLDIRDFELFTDYVKPRILIPHDNLGMPKSPPGIPTKRIKLESLKERHRQLKREHQTAPDKAVVKLVESPGHVGHLHSSPSSVIPVGIVRDKNMVKEEMRAVTKEIRTIKKELDLKASWGEYDLPESKQEAKKILDDLVDSLFLKEEVLKIKRLIKGPPQKTVTRAPMPTKPVGGRVVVPYSPTEKPTPEDIKKLPKKPPELPRRINGNDLMKRWNKRDFEIIAYVKEGLLNVYYHSGELIPKDSPYPLIINEYVIFDLSEVEELERKHPELLKEKVATSPAGQDEKNKVLPYEDFIKNLRLSYESDYEIKVQAFGKEAVSYKHKMLFFRDPKVEWRTLLDILKDPGHTYHINNEAERKRFKRISEKLIKSFNKYYPVKIPKGFNLFERCTSEKSGTYELKVQVVDPNTIKIERASKYRNLSNDQLLAEIEKLGKKQREIVEFDDEKQKQEILIEINTAVGIARGRNIPDDEIRYYLKKDKEKIDYDPYENEPSKPKNY